MVSKLSRFFISSCVVLFSSHAVAWTSGGSLSEAEALYKRRSEGRATVQHALAEFRKLLPAAKGQDLIHVVYRITSLDIFEGEYLLRDDNRSERNPIFGDCREVIERIATIPEGADVYHYMKLMCSALWVESATPLQLIGIGNYFKSYFNKIVTSDLNLRPELGVDPRLGGGGIYRTIAGISADPMSNMVHPALPSLDKAMEMIDLAMASPNYPGNDFAGADMYSNHRSKAEILIRMGRTAEGRELLESSIAEIQELAADDELRPGIEPETLGEISKMREVLDQL